MSKISDLAYALHQKTYEKKLKWDFSDETAMIVNIGTNSITVDRYRNTIGPSWYGISVRNIDGNTVDEESFSHEEEVYPLIAEMMTLAKRNSLKADETIDDIMERISKL